MNGSQKEACVLVCVVGCSSKSEPSASFMINQPHTMLAVPSLSSPMSEMKCALFRVPGCQTIDTSRRELTEYSKLECRRRRGEKRNVHLAGITRRSPVTSAENS